MECWMELGHTSSLILGVPVFDLYYDDNDNDYDDNGDDDDDIDHHHINHCHHNNQYDSNNDQVATIMLANLAILADVIRVVRKKLQRDQNQVRG